VFVSRVANLILDRHEFRARLRSFRAQFGLRVRPLNFKETRASFGATNVQPSEVRLLDGFPGWNGPTPRLIFLHVHTVRFRSLDIGVKAVPSNTSFLGASPHFRENRVLRSFALLVLFDDDIYKRHRQPVDFDLLDHFQVKRTCRDQCHDSEEHEDD